MYTIYTVGWDVGPTYNLSRPNLPAYIYTQTCSNIIFDASRKYTKTYSLKQEVLDTHPLKTLRLNSVSQNGQKHIWLSLFSKVQSIVLRTITYNSLPQITQHRHCIGSALDIVSSATNWNELVPDAITVQLQLNPTPQLAIDGNSSAIVWRSSANAMRCNQTTISKVFAI